MKLTRDLLLRVEGEAILELEWEDGRVKDARIILPSTRFIEKALIGRPVMDALVIAPRVCGICGHAHLMASVKAIEDALFRVSLSNKAKVTRDITLMCEIIQNHIKWFYLFVMPDILKFKQIDKFTPFKGKRWIEAIRVSSLINKVIALFSGQWPHSSYAVPGGITSDFKDSELYKALALLSEVKTFFLDKTVELEEKEFKDLIKNGKPERVKGDLGLFLEVCEEHDLLTVGRAYNRFLTGGEIFPCVEPAHFTGSRKLCYMNLSCVKEVKCDDGYSKAYAVRYRDLPYETGPLSRQFLSGNLAVREMHRLYGDSYATRVFARVLEIGVMCLNLEVKLNELFTFLDEPSWIEPEVDLKNFSGEGASAVEAARGTLIHKIQIEKGKIKNYTIITPSQWNLGPRAGGFLGVAEKAVLNVKDSHIAQMIVRSFDMCSVCTTH